MDKSLLASATSADEAPTPGYMLNDIASTFSVVRPLKSYNVSFFCILGMTLVSIDTSQQVMDYLMSRLKKDNCNVKHKVLVIIRVCFSAFWNNYFLPNSLTESTSVEQEDLSLNVR